MPEIKVEIESIVLLIFLLIYEPIHITAGIILAVALHEIGHLISAALLKVKVRKIKINLFGARINFENGLYSYYKEIIICICGPLINILLGTVGVLLMKNIQAGDRLLFFVLINYTFAIINLLPLETFDGGRILSVAVNLIFGEATAQKIMKVISFITVILLWMVSLFVWFEFQKNISLLIFSMYIFLRLTLKKEE